MLISRCVVLAGAVTTLVLGLEMDVKAWEATYSAELSSDLQQLRQGTVNLEPAKPSVIKYPSETGASLGQGWDLFLNKKIESTCIEFTEKKDSYQTAELHFQEATDEETRDVTLNINFSISGEGSFAGFKGK